MLSVANLSVRFTTPRGVVRAVDDVSFDVPDGATVGIVGETGSGKSATVRAIMGLLPPAGRVTGGSVVLRGTQLVGMPRGELRRIRGAQIGFIGQSPFGSLNPVLPIETQFRNALRAHGRWLQEHGRQ